MKVHGLLQPEGGAGTVIDNRKQVIQVLANLGEDKLRALVAGGARVLADATDNRAVIGSCGAANESTVASPFAVASVGSAAALHAERQRTRVEIGPAVDVFKDARADLAPVGRPDEHQAGVLAVCLCCNSSHEGVVND